MRVLVACEFSGIVRDAFARRGHDAWSCDLIESERPGNHVVLDVFKFLERMPSWDLMIFHWPCTYLTNSSVWLLSDQPAKRNFAATTLTGAIRVDQMTNDANAFRRLLDWPGIPRIAGENPIMHCYASAIVGQPFTQTIQPYEFGHSESKRTCLWLRNLPPLRPTGIMPKPACGHWNNQTPTGQNKLGPTKDRAQKRSRTYLGIADAMAAQWG